MMPKTRGIFHNNLSMNLLKFYKLRKYVCIK
nr:MAG TPA: hypothetical protein [Caudoviricetes sp.]